MSKNISVSFNKRIKKFNKTIKIPGDKSCSIRALLLASQCMGISEIKNLLESEDVLNCAKALKNSLGVKIVKKNGIYYVYGNGLNSFKTTKSPHIYNNISSYFKNPFFIGLVTNLLNPKATLFFISLFALVIDVNTSVYLQVFYGIWMSVITGLWFCLVSLLISSYYLKIFINKYSILVDKIMGVILILISIKIIFT